MPIKVICSRCGGLETLEFLYLFEPHWRIETCPDCAGFGHLELLSFEESREKINGSHTPLPPPTGGTAPD